MNPTPHTPTTKKLSPLSLKKKRAIKKKLYVVADKGYKTLCFKPTRASRELLETHLFHHSTRKNRANGLSVTL